MTFGCAVCVGTGFNDMKTELREYLKDFADSGKVSVLELGQYFTISSVSKSLLTMER